MNYLDVKRFGVQELNAKEMIEVEGGFLPLIAIVGIWAFQGAVIGGAISAYGSIRAAEVSAGKS